LSSFFIHLFKRFIKTGKGGRRPGVRPPGRRPLCRAMTLLLLPLDQDRDPRNEQRSSLNGRFSAKIPSPS
ncbi:hypothetical protein, partial [Streptomyces mirabilis]